MDPDLKYLKTAEKKLKAFELRKAGWSYRQIATDLGVKPQKVRDWIDEELRFYRDQCQESVQELVDIEAARCDELVKSLWEKAIDRSDVRAVETILKVMERKAKLLGLDAPEKQVRVSLSSLEDMSDDELLLEASRFGIVLQKPVVPLLVKAQEASLLHTDSTMDS